MSKIKTLLSPALACALVVFGLGSAGAVARTQSGGGANDERVRQLVSRLEAQMSNFNRSADAALDGSRLDGSALEDEINARTDEIERATDNLKDRAEDRMSIARDVTEVLGKALHVEMFMQKHRLTPRAQSDWAAVRNTLDDLARSYNVAWVWTTKNYPALSEESVRRIINRLEERADDFSESFDASLDRSRLDGTRYENHMNKVVLAFEESLDELSRQARGSDELKEQNVMSVLNNALAIEDYMRQHQPTLRARRDWARVKNHLDDLARLSRVTWVWTAKPGEMTITPAATNPATERR